VRWVRTLKNRVPGRLQWFDRHIDWQNKDVLDLGCTGGFIAEAMTARGERTSAARQSGRHGPGSCTSASRAGPPLGGSAHEGLWTAEEALSVCLQTIALVFSISCRGGTRAMRWDRRHHRRPSQGTDR